MTIFAKGNPLSVRSCFTCGKPLTEGQDELFCDIGCRDQLDAGGRPYADSFDFALDEYGFSIVCPRCGGIFDSRGLRACSPGCEAVLRAREDGVDDAITAGGW